MWKTLRKWQWVNKIDGVDQRFEKTKNKLTSKETMYVRTGKEH